MGELEVRRNPWLAMPLFSSVGFVLAIVAVLTMATLAFRSLEARSRAAADVTQTLNVLQQLESVLSTLKDAETGQRGYLLTGEADYLGPYTDAKARLAGDLKVLRTQVADDPERTASIEVLEVNAREKMDELDRTVALRRSGDAAGAMALVRTDLGRAAMDQVRRVVDDMRQHERTQLMERNREWNSTSRTTVLVNTIGSAVLLLLIIAAALMTSRDFQQRQAQIWIRTGRMQFANRIQGEHRLDKLGEHVLDFLAGYTDAQVGAMFTAENEDRFYRFASFACAPSDDAAVRQSQSGLLGQAVKERRTLHVRDVPAGYLPVHSSLGKSAPRELLLMPATADGVVHAVVELGFFHEVSAIERELLDQVAESLAIAVRSSKERTRLEELLEETQRQAEELQTQQEELRVNNEELEEQSRALKESQARLESQHVELEQINSNLEEQTQLLETHRDELTRAQRTLASKAQELERSNQYKSEFLANMSHELRTPLNSSLILSKLLADNKDGNLSDEQVRFAQTISSAGNDLLSLINDILDLSKIEAGKMEVTVERISMARTLDALRKTFEPVAEQKHLKFAVLTDPGVPDWMETDGQRLSQILKNLLSNALKFTHNGDVTLRVFQADDGNLSFAVADTGIGIASEHLQAVFEAFRQADGSTHRKFGGSGLGLSISRDLAHLLGGALSVQSRPGEGSVFTLTLPLAFTTRGESSVPPSRAMLDSTDTQPSLQRENAVMNVEGVALADIAMDDDRNRLQSGTRLILVVEDDVRFAEILRDLAHELGFQCVVTHTATDALKAAALYEPKAILLDINLPDHSGLRVLEELKRQPSTRHIPVHVASVADYTHEALELGAIGYALKPVKREALVEAFQRLESKFSQGLRRVLVVEDDARQRQAINLLLAGDNVEIVGAANAAEAMQHLKAQTFDCVVMDLNLPDLNGFELLEKMSGQDDISFPPVIIYTGRDLTSEEELRIRRFSRTIIVKDARSPERLLDEVTLFLHQVESTLPPERQRMLQAVRDREASFEGRRILVVEDDVRNIFALSSVLEPRGAKIEVARNGLEALEALQRGINDPSRRIDLVLMDIMMPEMDGLTATREIRKRPEWKKLPIIALTAKAMKDDHDKCLAAGASDYIAKPLDVERLLSLVRVWIPK